MNMTMTYDGTMVMPKNFAVVTEDEMTYVDGGYYRTATHYFSSAEDAYNDLNSTAWKLYGLALTVAISSTLLGAWLGAGAVGALIGCIGGVFAGCVVWGWASACDNGAMQAKKLGSRPCSVTYTVQNLTMNVSVS